MSENMDQWILLCQILILLLDKWPKWLGETTTRDEQSWGSGHVRTQIPFSACTTTLWAKLHVHCCGVQHGGQVQGHRYRPMGCQLLTEGVGISPGPQWIRSLAKGVLRCIKCTEKAAINGTHSSPELNGRLWQFRILKGYSPMPSLLEWNSHSWKSEDRAELSLSMKMCSFGSWSDQYTFSPQKQDVSNLQLRAGHLEIHEE